MNPMRMFLMAAVILVLTGAGLSLLWRPVLGQDREKVPPAPRQWEYKVITVGGSQIDGPGIEGILNKLGKEGWECCSTVSETTSVGARAPINARGFLICKRAR